jgi:hypothetical protein
MRRFSLDGFRQDQSQPNGNTTQTHLMFGFYDGQPPYDIVAAIPAAVCTLSWLRHDRL